MSDIFSKKQLDTFHEAVQSLKLYRRAELEDDSGRNLIDVLYVDPLPNEHLFSLMMRSNTTFLIGRKGTGKSTIIQRVQRELQKNMTIASAYIDIKTVYESSQIDQSVLEKLSSYQGAMPRDVLEKRLLNKAFIKSVIVEIKNDLKKRLQGSFKKRVKESFTGSFHELFENLDELLNETEDTKYESIMAIREVETQTNTNIEDESSSQVGMKAKIDTKPSLDASASASQKHVLKDGAKKDFSDIYMRIFNIKELLTSLKTILVRMRIKTLFIFIDDFSELPKDAMISVVDTLLAPLNNWSEEFIKFKVAAYPGRIYYGKIDRTKIDEAYLDIYKLYGTKDVAGMEDKAIDFTKRLLTKRISHYCEEDISLYLETENEEIWRILFYASMGNPRILGYVLYYLFQTHLIYQKKIGIQAIRDASRKYYEEKIESFFHENKFLHESYEEKASIFSMKELMESIVAKAKELRSYKESKLFKEIEGRVPTSHFHVLPIYDDLFSTLELNFFLTRYYQMSDRDGRRVTVYALNYGLCEKYALSFGRPTGKREHRLHFVERVFDYNSIVQNYMKMNQEIVCNECSEKFELDKLDALKMYDMKCPNCHEGICNVVNLSRKYESIINSIREELLLPKAEFGILQTLSSESRLMFAKEIAQELDCSYQLVGKRGKNLFERGLIERVRNQEQRRQFSIRESTQEVYFKRDDTDDLDV